MIDIRDNRKEEKDKKKQIKKESNNFKDKVKGGKSLKRKKNSKK